MRVTFVLILERLVCSGIFVFKTKTIYEYIYILFAIYDQKKMYLNILESWNITKKEKRKEGESEDDVKMEEKEEEELTEGEVSIGGSYEMEKKEDKKVIEGK